MSKSIIKHPKSELPAKRGRPSKYSDEVAAEICERVALGESIRQITLIEGMPSQSMIYRWLEDHPIFREQYARAREKQADHFLDEIRDIANDGRNDWEIIESERTGQERIVLNAEAVQRSRLRVDTLKWVMSKLSPKKYGDKLEVDQTVKIQPITYIGGDAN